MQKIIWEFTENKEKIIKDFIKDMHSRIILGFIDKYYYKKDFLRPVKINMKTKFTTEIFYFVFEI